MPEIRVFLDVDDLEDADNLESYIHDSAVFLMLLSQGYFSSQSCLREVFAMQEYDKPYVHVHLDDRAQGGAPLDEIGSELRQLNQELHSQIFDGRRAISWYHSLHFQVVSLIQITEDMLRCSPQLSSSLNPALSLYVPGSMLEQRFALHKTVTIYASTYNPGALSVLEEMPLQLGIQVTSTATFVRARERIASARLLKSAVIAAKEATILPEDANGSLSAHKAAEPETIGVKPTHTLVYLIRTTFLGPSGNALSQELRCSMRAGVPVIIIHETDTSQNGCEFAVHLQATPQDLIDAGLYRRPAIPFASGDEHRKVSYAILAQALGAVKCDSGNALGVLFRRHPRKLSGNAQCGKFRLSVRSSRRSVGSAEATPHSEP